MKLTFESFEEADKWIRASEMIGYDDAYTDVDEDGDVWVSMIFKRDDKYFRAEYVNGRLAHYKFNEVTSVECTVINWQEVKD